MSSLLSTDLAIAVADLNGDLRITKETGRDGPYWAIQDKTGIIEVALSSDEASSRVETVRQRARS